MAIRDLFPVYTAARGPISYDPNAPENVARREREAAELGVAMTRWGIPYEHLIHATTGLIREIVEIHEPQIEAMYHDENPPCMGCDSGPWSGSADWPCSTTKAIAASVGVELPKHWLHDAEDDL